MEHLDNVRAAERTVLEMLKNHDMPLRSVMGAYHDYRQVFQTMVFADFQDVKIEEEESRLWAAHSEGKKHLLRLLKDFRKNGQPVETRQLTKVYHDFLKQTIRFYREYIFKLSTAIGGIPELDTIAQKVNGSNGTGESLPLTIPPDLRAQVLKSCHISLVYLGDLFRYRASEISNDEKKKPDYGPAIGYYGLAATLIPTSGLGHHQQAVVYLEQQNHLRAIYHLYRAIAVPDPHPHASKNLRVEFEKTNVAWDKGDLILKGPPNDPEKPKRNLEGLFVRLHSMNYQGGPFRGYAELEREILTQLTNVVKQDALGETLSRMILINIAAQSLASERFQDKPESDEREEALLNLFSCNLRTFATLLQVFADNLKARLIELNDYDAELPAKLTPLIRRLMPPLRVYHNWLLIPMTIKLANMLTGHAIVQESIHNFWPVYARVVDLMAQAFPIWDLEDLNDVDYMLEEDVDTLEFRPFRENKRILGTLQDKQTGSRNKRFCDRDVARRSSNDETLHRIKDFLNDGVALANDEVEAPIKIHQTRIFYGDQAQIEPLVVKPIEYKPAPITPVAPPVQPAAKPVSYASAAANGHARQAHPASTVSVETRQAPVEARSTPVEARPAPIGTGRPKYAHTNIQEAQLTRMVDSLLDDSEVQSAFDRPPLSARTVHRVVNSEPRRLDDSVHDINPASQSSHRPNFQSHDRRASRPSVTLTPPTARSMRASVNGAPANDIQRLWDDTQPQSFQSGRPVGTLGSPAMVSGLGHSRVNSASSIRSRSSQNGGDGWTLKDSTPRFSLEPNGIYSNGLYPASSNVSFDQNGFAGPLLFGACESFWSTGLRPSVSRNVSPPNGCGG